MASKFFYQYYVEGDNEKKFIDTLKLLPGVVAGKVNKLNSKDQRITDMMTKPLRKNTIVILVFDTDTDCTEILHENIRYLKTCQNIKQVWCIPQDKNLEDELVKATDINDILEFYKSQGIGSHKKKFNNDKNLIKRLKEHHFDLQKLWIGIPDERYKGIENDSFRVKK